MATATLIELQKQLSVALGLDEEGRARRALAFARKQAALDAFDTAEPKARAADEAAGRANETARAKHADTEALARSTWFALQGTSEQRNREVNTADFELVETAPPAYAGFLALLERWFDECRHSHHGKSGTARMAAIRAARERVEVLRLDPREDGRAEHHVATLRKAIPPLEV